MYRHSNVKILHKFRKERNARPFVTLLKKQQIFIRATGDKTSAEGTHDLAVLPTNVRMAGLSCGHEHAAFDDVVPLQ
jgi:hypothetical protein